MNTIVTLILLLKPAMSREDAAAQAAAIQRAAIEHHVDAELLLAMAWTETRFDPMQVSRAKGSWFCGVLQVQASNKKGCDELANVERSYFEGAAHLRLWMRYAKGDTAAALRGYGCGFEPNTKRPRDACRSYDTRVLSLAKKLRRHGHEQPES